MDISKQIEELRIPDLPTQPPKNFFDITGIRNKEVINSRVLSFFLNPNEEHGFNSLFYDALLELIERKKQDHKPEIDLNIFKGDFEITEEEATRNVAEKDDQRKRIDLLLTGSDKQKDDDKNIVEVKETWAIIIENKLYHDVINPLHTYWDHKKQVPHKIGIILSLFEVEKKKLKVPNGDISYINITHQEFIDSVSKQFSFTSDYSETSLFYLKEYFKTIETHYSTTKNTPIMNKVINELISQKERINSLLQTINKTDKYILDRISKFFSDREFKVFNSAGTFFRNENFQQIFFAVRINDFLTQNNMTVYLVAFTKDNEKLIPELKEIAKSVINNSSSQYSVDGIYSGKEHTHLVQYTNKNFLSKNEDFDEKFPKLLDELFFKQNGIIDQVKIRLMSKN